MGKQLTDEDLRKYNEERPFHWRQARIHVVIDKRSEMFWKYQNTGDKKALRKYEEMSALLDKLVTPTKPRQNGGKNVRTS